MTIKSAHQARIAITTTAIALLFAACSQNSNPYGYWEGKGKASEIPMNETHRKLTRKADFEFWFTLAETGEAVGEIELDYDATLAVEGLPSISAPVPGGASVSFQPEVGGTLTDLDPTRRFPLIGVYHEGVLTLEVGVPEARRPPLEFTIRADAGVSGSMSVGPVGIGDVASGNAQLMVQKIQMTPFSPFTQGAAVEQRPGGPFAASFDSKGEDFSIEWSAVQRNQDQAKFELTPELKLELRRLRESL